MRRCEVAACVGCLILFVAATAAAQAPNASDRAKLRARVAGLRAEIELLRMEHNADAEILKAVLTDLRNMEGLEPAERSQILSDMKAKYGDVGADEARAKLKLPILDDPERRLEFAADLDKATLKTLRPWVDRKKKEFTAKTAALHEKAFELEDLERQYREPAPAAKLGDRTIRDGGEHLRQSLIGPSRIEDAVPVSREDVNRTPILDPIPGDPTANCCPDPPSEAEVWAKVSKSKDVSSRDEAARNNARFVIEKIGEKVDPCKVYPLAGPCQLVHCHYKGKVTFFEPLDRGEHLTRARTEVVYIDKDHLRRCGDATHAHAAKPDGPAVVRAALTSEPAADSDLGRRMTRVEEKLDRILKALERRTNEDD